MMKKRKINIFRLVLVILIAVLLVAILVLGAMKLLHKNPQKPTNNDPDITETDDKKLNIDLMDYVVFDDGKDEVGFNFVVARLRFSTSDGNNVKYDLANLSTSEFVTLDNGKYYSDKLMEKSYYLSSYNVVYNVKGNSDSYTCRIVIPYTKDNKTLIVSGDGQMLEFDLTKNVKSIAELKYSSGSDITIGGSFEAYISDAYITGPEYMTMDGEHIGYPSTVQVYTFKLHIKNVDEEDVHIVRAEFVSDTLEDNIYYALDDAFSSMKLDNLINKPLSKDSEGALFFEVINANGLDPDFNGTLRLMMSNQEDWIEISTK